jgi:hypothetical protein
MRLFRVRCLYAIICWIGALLPLSAQSLDDLRREQDYLKQAMRDNIDGSHFLIIVFAYLLASLVILQALREGYFQRRQRQREDELEARHTAREDQLDTSRREYEKQLRERWILQEEALEARRSTREDELEVSRREYERQMRELWITRDDRTERHRVIREQRVDTLALHSTRSISNILNVLHRTLEARRAAEDQARQAETTSAATISGLTTTIERLANEIAGLKTDAAEVKRTRENERVSIEDTAATLSLTPRHQFRHRLRSFEQFAQQYDSFRARHGSPDGDVFLGFKSGVSYVRGISAHYFNDPATATAHLMRVVGSE